MRRNPKGSSWSPCINGPRWSQLAGFPARLPSHQAGFLRCLWHRAQEVRGPDLVRATNLDNLQQWRPRRQRNRGAAKANRRGNLAGSHRAMQAAGQRRRNDALERASRGVSGHRQAFLSRRIAKTTRPRLPPSQAVTQSRNEVQDVGAWCSSQGTLSHHARRDRGRNCRYRLDWLEPL